MAKRTKGIAVPQRDMRLQRLVDRAEAAPVMAAANASPAKAIHVGFVDVFDWNAQTISFTIDRAILFDKRYEQSLLEMLRKCPERGERRFERIQLSTEAKA